MAGAVPKVPRAVEARGLTKTFGRSHALRDVNLSVALGERIAVFGPNGAGKTTLIKVLAGLLRPSGGTVRLWGKHPWGNAAAARSLIGVVTHQTYLYEELSGRGNLLFYAGLYGVSEPARRAQEALDAVGLTSRASDPVRTLSRGMQQRLAIARATLHHPPLLLLDEPDAGLDSAARATLSDLLFGDPADGASAARTTAVVATHSLEMGLTLCQRWLVLRDGQLVYDSQHDGGDRSHVEVVYRNVVGGGPA